MTNVNPQMRLKVKRDTFHNADPRGGVYFRNNTSSFRMEGEGIDQWIEKLLPMFNGEYSLADLTEGLPAPYRNQIFNIAETMYRNGFVRDLSQDAAHQLPESILRKYASQIEFLDHFGPSGAYRFQTYRQIKMLAVGSGPLFVALISALLESGLPQINMLITDGEPTNRQRLLELEEHARQMDPEVELKEVFLLNEGEDHWSEVVKPFDCLLFVSRASELATLRNLHRACRQERKMFVPAVCFNRVGLAGPLVHPESEGCWESAWRRVHQASFDNHLHEDISSATAEAMLVNVIVFESFKKLAGVTDSGQRHQIYLFDLATLEGRWHSFAPHPLVTGNVEVTEIQDITSQLEQSSNRKENSLLDFFGGLTSEQTGIFHQWEEGDLLQLPLAQCRVQAAVSLSDGPAELLPEWIGAGLTHEEARREAGLAGLELYVSRMTEVLGMSLFSESETKSIEGNGKRIVGVGAGETVAEAICRGLCQCLTMEWIKRPETLIPSVRPVRLSNVEDEHCQFYLMALTTMKGEPKIALGEAVFGFPVVWIGAGDYWVGSVGLCMTHALRNALQQAIVKEQNKSAAETEQRLEAASVQMEERSPINLTVPAFDLMEHSPNVIRAARQTLEQNQVQMAVFELTLEPFLKEQLAGVFGVVLREEEQR